MKKGNKSTSDTTAAEKVVALTMSTQVLRYDAGVFTHDDCGLTADDLRHWYHNMLLQRRFEERAAQMYGKQKIAGFLHLYIGQEAVSAGAAAAINIGADSVITAYRDHGLGLALGMTAKESMAELFGRSGGSSHGKGGSMHFFSAKNGFFGGHGIVGGHVPVGTGLAFAHKYNEDGGVSLSFFGDGAVGQGAIHEAMNLASLYKLPAIYIIENNNYAMGTATHRAFGEPEFSKLAYGYGIRSAVVDGMDMFSVCRAMQDAAAVARAEGMPSLLDIRTYRYRGHSMSDPMKYRTKEELEAKKEEDPIVRLKAYILEHELISEADLDAIDEQVKQEVLDAVEFADNSPLPDLEAIYDSVYVQEDYPFLA